MSQGTPARFTRGAAITAQGTPARWVRSTPLGDRGTGPSFAHVRSLKVLSRVGPSFAHVREAPFVIEVGPSFAHVREDPFVIEVGPSFAHVRGTPIGSDVVIESITVIQRDTRQSYLVDVEFTIYDSGGNDQEFLLEWKIGDGVYAPMTPQPFDRKHSAENPLILIPTESPGKTFNFVWQAFFDLPEGSFTDVSVRLTVADGIGLPHTYAGVAPIPGVVDEAFIEGLTSSVQGLDKALSLSGVAWTPGEYIWVAFPSDFNPTGAQDFDLSLLGFGYPGSFILAETGVLISTPESGAPPILYDVWRSTGAGSGLSVDLDVTA